MRRLKPEMEPNMAALEHRSDRHPKLALARATAPESDAATLDAGYAIKAATARANRAVWPKQALKPPVSGGFIVEEFGGKCGHGHELSP
jgi:hypothetical protein